MTGNFTIFPVVGASRSGQTTPGLIFVATGDSPIGSTGAIQRSKDRGTAPQRSSRPGRAVAFLAIL
jgi:hypothetical protein